MGIYIRVRSKKKKICYEYTRGLAMEEKIFCALLYYEYTRSAATGKKCFAHCHATSILVRVYS